MDCVDGKLFNQKRFKQFLRCNRCSKMYSPMQTACTEVRMQREMDQVSQCELYNGLTISTKMTVVVHQPSLAKPYNGSTTTVNGSSSLSNEKRPLLNISWACVVSDFSDA